MGRIADMDVRSPEYGPAKVLDRNFRVNVRGELLPLPGKRLRCSRDGTAIFFGRAPCPRSPGRGNPIQRSQDNLSPEPRRGELAKNSASVPTPFVLRSYSAAET